MQERYFYFLFIVKFSRAFTIYFNNKNFFNLKNFQGLLNKLTKNYIKNVDYM